MEETTHEPEQLTEAPAPRSLEEIKKEALGVWAQAGELQYEIKRLERVLTSVNMRLEILCNEGEESVALDKQAQAKQNRQNLTKAVAPKNRKAQN